MFIDADSHVDECADTWSYFPKEVEELRPVEMTFDETPKYFREPSKGVFIDGQVFGHFQRSDENTRTTVGSRELYDIPERLRHMDELNVSHQVLFPTLLIREVTKRAEVEIPVCEAYNRWVADRCSESGGRLRWTGVLPLRSIPDALKEMKRIKDAGAVGIAKRGVECDHRRAGNPYFFPIYELAEELDLPVCIHVTHPYSGNQSALTKTQTGIFSSAYVIDSFLSVLLDGVAARFPRLRFGFIEAGSGWLPYTLWLSTFAALFTNQRSDRATKEHYRDILADARMFVTCESTEDLPDIIGHVGDDNLCVGTDYAHADRASMIWAHTEVLERKDISHQSALKLTELNARKLYGIMDDLPQKS